MVQKIQSLSGPELVRILNSTPEGDVATEYSMRKWRNRAGLHIGQGGRIDFFRFSSWVYDQRFKLKAIDEQSRGQQEVERQRELRGRGRDVIISDCLSPVRRDSCAEDPELFIRTYFNDSFSRTFAPDAKTILRKAKRCIMEGELFAEAAPRGFGKSTLLEIITIWGVVYGYIKFVIYVGANDKFPKQSLANMRRAMEASTPFCEDFPGIMDPVEAIAGVSQRAAGMTIDFKPIYFEWSKTQIAFPHIPGNPWSGAIIQPIGITGAIRGANYTPPGGGKNRPDFVVIDDPQTKKSAGSPGEVEYRLGVIQADILGLAEHGKKFGAVALVTVIAARDVADQLVNRDISPEWVGERMKMVYEWPDDLGMWEKYKNMRRKALREEKPNQAENAFYKKNRTAMDKGSRVICPEWFNPDKELSTLQSAYNLIVKLGQEDFEKEYQNEPPMYGDEEEMLTTGNVVDCIADYDMDQVNPEADFVLMAIDVQKRWLYWEVCAFEEKHLTSWSVGWGVKEITPEGSRMNPTPGMVRASLEELYTEQAERHNCLSTWIDAGYKHGSTRQPLIRQWVKTHEDVHAVVGRGHGWMPKLEGKQIKYARYNPPGQNNIVQCRFQRDRTRLWFFDADILKMEYHNRLRLDRDAPGCLYYPKELGSRDYLWYCRHVVAEQLVKIQDPVKGEVLKWQGSRRHDMLDVRMMLHGAAMIEQNNFSKRVTKNDE